MYSWSLATHHLINSEAAASMNDKGEGPSSGRRISPASRSVELEDELDLDLVDALSERDIGSLSCLPTRPTTPEQNGRRPFPGSASPRRSLPSSPLHARLYAKGDPPDVGDSSSVRRRTVTADLERAETGSLYPPSFAESQFATIVRRQRRRRIFSPLEHELEHAADPSARGAGSEIQAGPGPPRKRTISSASANAEPGVQSVQLKVGRAGSHMASMGRHAWQFAGWEA